MKELNLDVLNLKSPYTVWYVGKHNYGFKTRYGVLYRVQFAPEQTIWDDGAYEFAIINENGKPSPNDIDIQYTIVAIIEEFFSKNPDILLYQCETGDNKQAARERLFVKWFSDNAKDKFSIKVTEIIAEGITNYAAIIVQRNNPKLQSIFKEFDEFIGFLTEKPE